MLLGEIDEVPGRPGEQHHKIATRFFAAVVPVGSMCVVSESFELRHGGAVSEHAWRGEPVRFNVASVLLGLSRFWTGIAVFALPFVLFYGQTPKREHFIPSAIAFFAWVLLLVVPGMLTKERRRRLRVLRSVVDLGCDPAFREARTRARTSEQLTDLLRDMALPVEPSALAARVGTMRRDDLEVVFAAAWYRSVDEHAWRELREVAWRRLDPVRA
jgi:hypothetical protein